MTPAERAVIDAAMSWDWTPSETGKLVKLAEACKALRAERTTDMDHTALPWAKVVTEDEVYSEATKRWYRVLSTELKGNPIKIEVWMEGVRKPFLVEPGKLVPVRRSDMGRAVDVWTGAEVMKSGPAE